MKRSICFFSRDEMAEGKSELRVVIAFIDH